MGQFERALGHFGVALTSLWGDFGVMLWSLRASGGALGSRWGRFKFTLGAVGGHCTHMNLASGHFGIALGLL